MRTFGCIALSALVLALLVACAPAQPASSTTASSTASAAVSLPSGRASLTSPASAPRPSQNASSAGGLCGYPTAPPQDAGVLTINNISPVDFAPWEAFLGAVNLGETATIRLRQYTTEGDPVPATLTYDGARFTLEVDSTADKFSAPEDRRVRTFHYDHLIGSLAPEIEGFEAEPAHVGWFLTDSAQYNWAAQYQQETIPSFLLFSQPCDTVRTPYEVDVPVCRHAE
nr:DUF4362 domain-containing protein [Maliibacterium massiliense]